MSYFEDALSNFLKEFTTAGSIKHLVQKGYSLDQILETISYPASRERVSKEIYAYMLESKILLEELDFTKYNKVDYKDINDLYRLLETSKEKIFYFECPFGYLNKNDLKEFQKIIKPLTKREQDYLTGIAWIRNKTYHIANRRMVEIAGELSRSGYFLDLYRSI